MTTNTTQQTIIKPIQIKVDELNKIISDRIKLGSDTDFTDSFTTEFLISNSILHKFYSRLNKNLQGKDINDSIALLENILKQFKEDLLNNRHTNNSTSIISNAIEELTRAFKCKIIEGCSLVNIILHKLKQ